VAEGAGYNVDVAVASRVTGLQVGDVVGSMVPSARLGLHTGVALQSLAWTVKTVLAWQRRGGGVIYAPFPQSMLLAFVALKLSPRHTTLIVGLQGTPIPESVAFWKRPIYRFALRRVLSDRAVRVVAVSNAQMQEAFDLVGLVGRSRGTVIGNVAHGTGDAPWVSAIPGENATQRAPQNLAVVLARLSWEKGVDVAIRALGLCHPSVMLKIGGEGPERAELERIALSEGVADRVIFAGWCDSGELLREASVVVIPSRREGLPAVLLEAAWVGVPIVASAVGGIPEVARQLTQATLVVPDDTKALAEAIDSAIGTPRTPARPSANWAAFADSVERVLACFG
jgi:glycosyltransferase involved in cell wall biosynthesis